MKPFLLLPVLAGLVLCASCRKDAGVEPAAPPVHQAYPHGTPAGPQVTKTIGAEGGTLTSTDGTVALTIPAGAVAAATSFSIQPVENTLAGARTGSFRLLPEGVTFAKPVRLRFSYARFPLEGTLPEALFLGYQKADGTFWLVPQTALDTENKTLTVETTHFSDWKICERFRVVADKTVLKRGEQAGLKLEEISLIADLAQPHAAIADWVDCEMTGGMKLAWSLVGAGRLDPAQTQCTYTAPGATPARPTVLVNLSLSGFDRAWFNGRIEKMPTQLTLITPLEIADGEYVRYTFKDIAADINGDCETGCVSSEMSKSTFSFRTTMSNNRYLDVQIRNFPQKAGTYTFSTESAGIEVNSGLHSDRYVSSSLSCEPPRQSVHSPGGIQITRWAGQVGEYTEGSFTTHVYKIGECQSHAESITCKFRLRRER